MNYTPRYNQPFTLGQAALLDVAIITEEITRLQHSLEHLRRTQVELYDYVGSSSPPVDQEFAKAIEENKVVIGSQEERIGMLKLVLTEKGVLTSGHCDLASTKTANTIEPLSSTIYEEPVGDEGLHL